MSNRVEINRQRTISHYQTDTERTANTQHNIRSEFQQFPIDYVLHDYTAHSKILGKMIIQTGNMNRINQQNTVRMYVNKNFVSTNT